MGKNERYRYLPNQGPFRVSEIREGDPYELSSGHPVLCMPTGGRGADAAATGTVLLKSDPKVTSAGVEAGYSPSPDVLRAPDIAVGNVPQKPGWIQGAPLLAVEYADTGQDEVDLAAKIKELLGAGTKFVWVVRLTGPRRVEVHRPRRKLRIARPGEMLEAPGILQNPVPVEALFDWQVGREIALRNLLQHKGYADLDAVRAEAEMDSLAEAILTVLGARRLAVSAELRDAVAACRDRATLQRWLARASTVAMAQEILHDAT